MDETMSIEVFKDIAEKGCKRAHVTLISVFECRAMNDADSSPCYGLVYRAGKTPNVMNDLRAIAFPVYSLRQTKETEDDIRDMIYERR